MDGTYIPAIEIRQFPFAFLNTQVLTTIPGLLWNMSTWKNWLFSLGGNGRQRMHGLYGLGSPAFLQNEFDAMIRRTLTESDNQSNPLPLLPTRDGITSQTHLPLWGMGRFHQWHYNRLPLRADYGRMRSIGLRQRVLLVGDNTSLYRCSCYGRVVWDYILGIKWWHVEKQNSG